MAVGFPLLYDCECAAALHFDPALPGRPDILDGNYQRACGRDDGDNEKVIDSDGERGGVGATPLCTED
jgi:hypothetical protein